MLDRTLELVGALRETGIPIAVSADIDAVRALAEIGLTSREDVRAALAATMIKDQDHRPAFDTLFDIYFALGEPARPAEETPDAENLLNALFETLVGGGESGLEGAASDAVERFGRVENSPSGSLYFQYPVWRAIDLDAMAARFEAQVEGSQFDRAVARARFESAVARLRALVETEVNRRVAQRKGPAAVARYAVRGPLSQVDLATASREEIAQLRRAIRPLARKLAARLALKHKRHSRGRLDLRRTVRHSLSTGGVPFDPVMRKRSPHKPELFVLCDVSSSVARFARFSLMLVHALSSQFSKVRSFAFVDTIDEVTSFFNHEDFLVAVDRMNEEAEVVWLDNHSNYATALERFAERYGKEVGPKTTLLILGDARNNNRDPRPLALKELAARARHTYWLNPEQQSYWDTGDSVASTYAAHTDAMVEVRNLQGLEEFVARVL